MRRKKIIEAAVVCILLLLFGAYMEFSDRSMDDKNRIIRGSPGSGRQEVELTLNAGEKLKNYDYQVSVPAQCIDEKTAQSYFSRAEKEIDETFFPEGEEAAHVTEQVHMKPSYVKGLVKADWTLDQYNAVDVDGTIREDQLDPQGELVQASVALTCEKYREEYTFSFQVYPKVMSQQEVSVIDMKMAKQMREIAGSYASPSEELIAEVLCGTYGEDAKPKEAGEKVTIPKATYSRYLGGYSKKEANLIIEKALAYYFENNEEETA